MNTKTADGQAVSTGDRAFDYYNMQAGVLGERAGGTDDGWFYFIHDDGSRELLNGERICSLAHARRMGWLSTR